MKKSLLFLFVFLLKPYSVIGTDDCVPRGYVRANIGGSFSQHSTFDVDNNDWALTQEGYNDNLGHAPFFGLGVGFNGNDVVSAGLSFTFRSRYKYRKSQTPAEGQSGTFLPDPELFIRKFDLDNQSFMVDLFLNRVGCASRFQWCIAPLAVAPYLGASIGFSKTAIYNFHTQTPNAQATVDSFTFTQNRAIGTYTSFNKFAWSLQAGFDFIMNEAVALGIGYRYFDGGRIRTPQYIIDDLDRMRTYMVTPWKASLREHEIVVSLSMVF